MRTSVAGVAGPAVLLAGILGRPHGPPQHLPPGYFLGAAGLWVEALAIEIAALGSPFSSTV